MKKTALLLIPLLLAALAAGYLLLGRDKPVRVAVQAVEKGAVEATEYVPYLAKMGGRTSSSTAKTSSWEAKAISISS